MVWRVVFQGANVNGNEIKNEASAGMKQLAEEINERIESIRRYIQIDRQEILLMAVSDITTFSNPIPEGDVLFYRQDDVPSRPVEYCKVSSLQRITQSVPMSLMKILTDWRIGMLMTKKYCFLSR
mgnify:CR=1 FL=1